MRRTLSYAFGLLTAGMLALAAEPADAQTMAAGPYYATPSWDQTLPPSTRFIVLSNFNNEAVLDRETGLVWERSPVSVLGTDWFTAVSACERLIVANRLGWRLPSVQELTSLVDPTQGNPALPPGNPFSNIMFFVASTGRRPRSRRIRIAGRWSTFPPDPLPKWVSFLFRYRAQEPSFGVFEVVPAFRIRPTETGAEHHLQLGVPPRRGLEVRDHNSPSGGALDQVQCSLVSTRSQHPRVESKQQDIESLIRWLGLPALAPGVSALVYGEVRGVQGIPRVSEDYKSIWSDYPPSTHSGHLPISSSGL